MGSPEPSEPDAATRRSRRALLALLRWLPGIVAAAALGTALVAVEDRQGPATAVPTVGQPRPTTPVLSLRRHLSPLGDQAAHRRLTTTLAEFVAGQPADTCLRVDAGGISFEHRVDDPQMPASTQKLLTGVAALSELGADTSFETTVVAASPPESGVVSGDLHLVGGGDPLLSTAEYAARFESQPQTFSDVGALADAVVAAGIARIGGAVVGDDSRYDAVRYHPAWPARFIAQHQTGPLSALSVNDAFVRFPPRGPEPVVPADDPARHGAGVLTEALRARGVVVVGEPRSGPAPPGAPVLAVHRSPPMREVVGQMLRESDNGTAELLVKELGLARYGAGSSEAGARAVEAILDEHGFAVPAGTVVDGSGLATQHSVTCSLLADVLDHDPTEAALRDGLAVAGQRGTLRDRWLGSPLAGRVRAKTGTLNQVTALAGYADSDAGSVRFALVVNLELPDRVDLGLIASQQQLAEILVAHPDRPDLSNLVPRSPR